MNLEIKIEDLVERQELVLSRLLEWIKAADSRLRLVLPISTTMLGALAVLIPPLSGWTVLGGIAASGATFFLALSITFAAFASFPRTKGPLGSLIYFGGIVSKDLGQYEAAVKSQTLDEYLEDLVRQSHRNAQIADQKFVWLQRSIGCMFAAAVPWALAIFILYSGTL